MNQLPVFITGNQNKADYLARMLGVTLAHKKIDVLEIQSASLDEVVRYKAEQAYAAIGAPVLVEDVSLGFGALGGLPGPFIRYFVNQPDGLEMLCRMLDGFGDKTATAACVFGYYDGTALTLFRGSLDGVIVAEPRGSNGFGWDRIFAPEGYGGRTRAELNALEDQATYMIMKPFGEIKEFLDGR